MAKKTCFVVGPIGKEGTDARVRADALLKHIIKKVLEAPPFEMDVQRADEMEPGLITQQIIERVVNANLVVADLTDRNANAHYELALRHVTRKPIVHMLLEGQALPFDIAHQRTIYYDTQDLDAAEQAKVDLAKHVDAVLRNPEAADNPIAAALLVLDLAKSKGTTDQTLARILKAVTELREDLRLVQRDRDTILGTTVRQMLGKPRGLAALRSAFFDYEKHSQQEGLLRYLDKARAGEAAERAAAPPATPAPVCANCGKPIVGPVGRRSSDSAPIHWEGKCPPPEGGLLSDAMPTR